MNKQILAQLAAARVGITVRDANLLLGAVLDVIEDELKAGRPVALSKIGTLEPVVRAPRDARNPRTGERIRIPQRTMVRFRVSRTLVDRLNRDTDGDGQ